MKRAKLALIAGLGLAALASSSCNEKVVIDPYAEASLAQVLNGAIESPNYRFKLMGTQFAASTTNFGLLKEGDTYAFIVGENINRAAGELTSFDHQLCVRKVFHPYSHLRLEQTRRGMDTTFIETPLEVTLPVVFARDDHEGYGLAEYDTLDINTLRHDKQTVLRNYLDKKVFVEAPFQEMEVDGETEYMIIGQDVRFQITDLSPSARMLFSILHGENGGTLRAGLIYTDLAPYSQRQEEAHIVGPVSIDWFEFGGKIVKN